VGVEKANFIEPQPSVEAGTAETLGIDMCLALRIFDQVGCWRNRVFRGHFKTLVNFG
jgi:hypothetical protein